MITKKSLSERLADLTSVAPSETFNPDAPDFDDGTGAGLSRYDEFEDEQEVGFSGDGPSADLRVAADMESIGQEYHGKKVSRKTLEATSGMVGDAPDPEASDGRSSSDDDGGDLDDTGRTSAVTSLNLDDISSSEDDAFDDNDDDDAMDTDGDSVGAAGSNGGISAAAGGYKGGQGGGRGGEHEQLQDSVFAGVRGEGADATVDAQIMRLDRQDMKAKRRRGAGVAGEGELKRAREALRQRQWWDSLLEVRILLQRLLNAANKLPGPNELPLFLAGDDSLTALAEEGAGTAQGLARQLSTARRSHMACWGLTPHSATTTTSASLDENPEQTNGDLEKSKAGQLKKDGEGEEEEEEVAVAEHGVCMEWWESVLGRWHEKTQLVDPGLQKKFRVVNQGPWAQVTASLANRERANRRAFMTESETDDFLGRKLAKLKSVSQEGTEASAASSGENEEGRDIEDEVLHRERRHERDRLDLEVLDDRNLYQHLLKEFMDASGAGGGGYGVSAGVPLRRKSRKNKAVDRRASKGRKIKYVTHPKMQNFMFPQEYDPAPMEPSELFASLFGGAGNNTQ